MKIEVCNLCYTPVCDLTKTEVIIKDHKAITFDWFGVSPARRKFRGVICDKCLGLLRSKGKKE